jgi:hypothetical protein
MRPLQSKKFVQGFFGAIPLEKTDVCREIPIE